MLDPEDRIYGGYSALPGSWPWQAGVYTHRYQHFCGGALINDRYILTAAHCVWSRTSTSVRVHLGAYARRALDNTEVIYKVEEVCAHPNYKPNNLNTVSDVIRHCRTFEALKTRRITPKFGRLANVTTVASVDASPQTDLSATIRQIVREELLRHEEQTRYAVPRCASVAFRDAVCASPPATWQHSVNAADCNSYRHDPHYGQTEQRHYDSIDRRFDQHPRDVRPRRPSTAYDIQGEGMSYSQPVAAVEYFNQRPEVRPLPVCYNCGTPGHIARYCNRRRAFSNGQSGSFMQHGGRAMDTNRPGNTTFEGYFREERSRHFPLDSYSGEQERCGILGLATQPKHSLGGKFIEKSRELKQAITEELPQNESACSMMMPELLCGSHDYGSSCFGDSGGPLVHRKDGIWTLYGLVTSGPYTCGDASDYPLIFARVSHYMDNFIAPYMDPKTPRKEIRRICTIT
ncbi:hypothetical protein HPB51_005022 [Rhipicephalus microplus]|uniref:Uncharacterized protein n=1 Tax=Rhipicephalus microplus TaxID=6941 RepID=A0A9J6EX12_RHIMP|nr:hypothetical protein HPB51_005022 [Rhipicephalus microplus]